MKKTIAIFGLRALYLIALAIFICLLPTCLIGIRGWFDERYGTIGDEFDCWVELVSEVWGYVVAPYGEGE